jgi:hypothetical protein
MAEIIKVLGQVDVDATTEATLYTVPSYSTAVISSISVCERNNAAATFRISVSVAGAATATKDYIYYDHTLGANDTIHVCTGITLNETDVVRVYASTTDVSFSIFGVETTREQST